MLSGGLDSSAVAVIAAGLLRERGERLTAYTSVPIGPVPDDPRRFGDELPAVRAIADAAGNIDVVSVPAGTLSPIAGIRWALAVYAAPIHGASNMFWMLDLQRQARTAGCRILLNGARGNASISWPGHPLSQPLVAQVRTLGLAPWLRRRAWRALPALRLQLSKRRLDPEWYRASAIAPAFARRLDLPTAWLEDPETRPRLPRDARLALLKPGRNIAGSNMAELGAWFGIDLRDPTGDARVVAFTMSVPDRIFRSPDDGSYRWLIREAMRGRLPDEIRLNQRRGLQAADLVSRLRHCAEEVDDALEELETGPARAYLDVGHMRDSWRTIRRQDTTDTHRLGVSVLTRGIMGGLFANAVVRGELPGEQAPDGAGVLERIRRRD